MSANLADAAEAVVRGAESVLSHVNLILLLEESEGKIPHMGLTGDERRVVREITRATQKRLFESLRSITGGCDG